ncbi:hypothetical protein EYF80_030166 [Liparis tanakae]|uniref:Uncharacterized protein n=1 Tax=Liparis tanakae TaxID=230148 RepID=A0A4Z2H442_9TELE|nr:hypothetical protein EYF80_030166 [Liparis tanakae]
MSSGGGLKAPSWTTGVLSGEGDSGGAQGSLRAAVGSESRVARTAGHLIYIPPLFVDEGLQIYHGYTLPARSTHTCESSPCGGASATRGPCNAARCMFG